MTKITKNPKSKNKNEKANQHVHDENCDHDHKPELNKLVANNDSVELTLKWQVVEPAWKKAVTKASRNLKLPGFRIGKVPAHLAEPNLNTEYLIETTLLEIVPSAFQAKVEESKGNIAPITRPEVVPIKTEKGSDWQIKVQFAQKPVIKLTDYKKLIATAKKKAAKQLSAQGGSASGGKAIEASEAKESNVKGQKSKIAKLSKQQQDDLTLKFIFSELVTGLKPKIQELLVRQQTTERLQEMDQSLKQMKLSINDYLERTKLKFEQLVAQFQAESLGQLQLEFILQALSEELKIKIDDKQLQVEIDKVKDPQVKKMYLDNEYYRERLRLNLIRQATIEKLLAI